MVGVRLRVGDPEINTRTHMSDNTKPSMLIAFA